MFFARSKFPSYIEPNEIPVYIDPVYTKIKRCLPSKPKGKKIFKILEPQNNTISNWAIVPYKKCSESNSLAVRKDTFKRINPNAFSHFKCRRVMEQFVRNSGNFPLVPYVAPPFKAINNGNIFIDRQLKTEYKNRNMGKEIPSPVCTDPVIESHCYNVLDALYDKSEITYKKLCEEIRLRLKKDEEELNANNDVEPSFIY